MKRNVSFLILIILLFTLVGCNKNEYTITLQDDDNVFAWEHVKKNSTLSDVINKLGNPQKEGYTFDGWYLDEEKYDINKKITEDLILNSKWIINQYTYIFKDDDGTILKEAKVDYLSQIISPVDPIKEEKTFIGWDQEFSVITNDITITALYRNYLTYTFMDFDGTILKTGKVDIGQEIIAPEVTEKEGVRFLKWDKAFANITEDTIITAVYINQYTYTFIDWDDTVLKKQLVDEGSKIIEPIEPTRYGYCYTFSGWDQKFDRISSDITIKALYDERTYNLEGKIVSFLGDSISTFYSPSSPVNSDYTGENEFYYPTYSTTVKNVTQTWWYQVIDKTNTILGVNNSLSGSDLVNSASTDTRLNKLDDKGIPDIIIINIGTNDNVNGHSKATIEAAYRLTINRLKNKYPNAIIFCCTLGYSAYTGYNYNDKKRLAINEIVNTLSKEFNIGIIDIASVQTLETYKSILGDNLHPNANGMTIYANEAVRAINEYFNLTQ